ncbi:hypothetical protein ABZY58_11140 [Micromonospora tulbaghiae]|uniref:hypothetical protein n=1 Tax=Micromonospora tulbaghiae TaxID=479978 RepID=UPI0033B87612
MPSIVIKPDRYRDLYVYWSTVVEAPVAWGDRAFMRDHLAEEWRRKHPGATPDRLSDPARRIDRADACGTSAAGGYSFFGRWDDDGFVYEQRGILPRRHLARACELLEAERESEVWDLLEPFEHELEVRRG